MKGLRVRLKDKKWVKGYLTFNNEAKRYEFEWDGQNGRVITMFHCNYTIFEYLHSTFFTKEWMPLTFETFDDLRK